MQILESYQILLNFSDQNFTDESKNLKNCERYSATKVAEFSYPYSSAKYLFSTLSVEYKGWKTLST